MVIIVLFSDSRKEFWSDVAFIVKKVVSLKALDIVVSL